MTPVSEMLHTIPSEIRQSLCSPYTRCSRLGNLYQNLILIIEKFTEMLWKYIETDLLFSIRGSTVAGGELFLSLHL